MYILIYLKVYTFMG